MGIMAGTGLGMETSDAAGDIARSGIQSSWSESVTQAPTKVQPLRYHPQRTFVWDMRLTCRQMTLLVHT